MAFANSNGGKLILGIDDDGTIAGTRNIEGEIFVLEDAIEKLIMPSLTYTVHTVKLNPKKGIAVFDVPEGLKKTLWCESDYERKRGNGLRQERR